MLKGDAFLGFRVEESVAKCAYCGGTCGSTQKGTLAQGDINITIHGPKKPPEPKEETTKGSGDFTDCMDRIVPKAKPDDPNAFCAWYEHEQTGGWPGEKSASSLDPFLAGRGTDTIEKMWSDEARQAAAESRARNVGAAPGGNAAQSVMAARQHGWAQSGDLRSGRQDNTHGAMPGHTLQIGPDGSWRHVGPGGLDVTGNGSGDLSQYLAHLHGRTATE